MMNGFSIIVSSFIAFSVYHVNPNGHLNQWQWMMIITTILTVIGCFGFYFFFPDNPKMAYFLTEEEKVHVMHRIKENRNGVETKTWKKYQCLEVIFNIKTWLFFFSGITNLIGGIGVQYSILIKSYGFSTAQTTVLNIPSGFAVSISVTE